MVTHVGVDLVTLGCLLFDTTTKQQRTIRIQVDYRIVNYFNELLRSIVTQIQGDLGCICFCWQYNYGEKTKADLLTNAKNFGFSDVKIIDDCMVKCWFGLSNSSTQPKTGKIWIVDWIYQTSTFVIYIWECNNGKLKYLQKFCTKCVTEEFVFELSKNIGGAPSKIIYYFVPKDNLPSPIVKVVLLKIFPDCSLSSLIPDYDRNYNITWALKEAMSENPYHSYDVMEEKNTNIVETIVDSDYEIVSCTKEKLF